MMTPPRPMVEFAEALFAETDGLVPTGDEHFALLRAEVLRLQPEPSTRGPSVDR